MGPCLLHICANNDALIYIRPNDLYGEFNMFTDDLKQT